VTTTNKSFTVKNNLVVDGSQITLGTVPISFNTNNNKLQIYINNQWIDISDSNDISFMDLGLAIDYDGNPIYTVQANGVVPSSSSKFADGGLPETTSFASIFDSGTI